MTEIEWGEANDEWDTAQTVFYWARVYSEKGWLSAEGFQHATELLDAASKKFDAAYAAYYAED